MSICLPFTWNQDGYSLLKFPDHGDFIRPEIRKRTAVLQHGHRLLIYLKAWVTKRAATKMCNGLSILCVTFLVCCHHSVASNTFLLNYWLKGLHQCSVFLHHHSEFPLSSAMVQKDKKNKVIFEAQLVFFWLILLSPSICPFLSLLCLIKSYHCFFKYPLVFFYIIL